MNVHVTILRVYTRVSIYLSWITNYMDTTPKTATTTKPTMTTLQVTSSQGMNGCSVGYVGELTQMIANILNFYLKKNCCITDATQKGKIAN